MADEVQPFGDGTDDQQRKADGALIRAEYAERIGGNAQRRAVDQTAAGAVGHGDRLTDQEKGTEQCRAGQQRVLFKIDALADELPRPAEGRQFVQVREQPGNADNGDHKRDEHREADPAAHQQKQTAGQNDQRRAGTDTRRHVAGKQIHRAGAGQAAAAQGLIHALDKVIIDLAPNGQLRAGGRVVVDMLRPGNTGDSGAHRRRVEGIVPLSAEGLLDQHGRDDSNNDDAVGNAGGHQQHDQRCKALAGRLVGAVALAMQRGQGAITQIGRHQGCQHQQHRAQAVIVPGHARKGHGTPQQITIVAIVLAAFDRRLFCHGAWVLLWVNGCRAAYR